MQVCSHKVRKDYLLKMQTPVFLPGKFHGQRSPAGCSPWGHMTGHTRMREVEGNGNGLVAINRSRTKKKKKITKMKSAYVRVEELTTDKIVYVLAS